MSDLPAIIGSRERLVDALLSLSRELPLSASLVTLVPGGQARHVPVHAWGMSSDHVAHGLDYFIPRSPEFRHVLAKPESILTWDDVPEFRDTATAREHLLAAGYTDGTSLALRHHGQVIGSFHLNVSGTGGFSSGQLETLHRAQTTLTSVIRGMRSALSARLSLREQQVLTLVASGLSNQEIAKRLLVTPRTVSTHVEHLLAKLGARNRVEAVVTGISLGLLATDLA